MPRKKRSDDDLGLAVLDIAKSAGNSFLRGLGQVIAIAIGGGIMGSVVGGVVAVSYQLPFMVSLGVGFVVGLVIVFGLMILFFADY